MQLCGIESLGANHEFAYCGNDFGATRDLDHDCLITLLQGVRKVGNQLGRMKYRGLFGLDVILSPNGEWTFLEINPRWQGSTMALERLEANAGNPSTVARHLAAIGVLPPPHTPVAPYPEPLSGMNLVITKPGSVNTTPHMQKPCRLPPYWEAIGLPATGTNIATGAAICRLIGPSSGLEPNGKPKLDRQIQAWIANQQHIATSQPVTKARCRA